MGHRVTTLNVNTIEPAGSTLTLGASGDTIVGPDSVNVNAVKDAGGNTIYTSNGSGTLTSVNSAFGDAEKILATQIASGVTSLTFTSDFDSSYNEYIFRFREINPATDSAYLQVQVSTDGGSNYNITNTSTYWSQYHDEDDTVAGLALDPNNCREQETTYQPLAISIGFDADQCAVGEFHIFNVGSTTYIKNYYSRTQTYQKDNFSTEAYIGGYFNTATALNAISFQMSTGNFDGTIIMYGAT